MVHAPLLSDLLDKELHIKIEDTSRQLYPTIKQFPVIYATVISCKIRDNEPRLDSICKKVHCPLTPNTYIYVAIVLPSPS